jgi:hypothetical protein
MKWLRLYVNVVDFVVSFPTHFELPQSKFGWRNYDNLKFIANECTITYNNAAIRYTQ